MPQGRVKVDRPLTNMSILYKNAEYIAQDVLGDLAVKKENDLYWVHNADQRLPETIRADKSKANMVTWDASLSSYYVNEHAVKDVVTDRMKNNADSVLQLRERTMGYLIDKLLLRQENDANQLLFTTTTFSNNTTLTSATSWRYLTITSAPIQNVLSATSFITQNSGKKPNYGVTNIVVRDALKENNNIHERLKYTQKSILTDEILASVFDLDKLWVGSAIVNTAEEGQTDDKSGIWGSDFLVGYFKTSPGLMDVTAATNFRVKQFGSPFKVTSWREEDIDGEYIQVSTMFRAQAVATVCGYLIKTPTL